MAKSENMQEILTSGEREILTFDMRSEGSVHPGACAMNETLRGIWSVGSRPISCRGLMFVALDRFGPIGDLRGKF